MVVVAGAVEGILGSLVAQSSAVEAVAGAVEGIPGLLVAQSSAIHMEAVAVVAAVA